MTPDYVLPPNDDRDEPLAALLRAAERDAAPLDREFLARLAESSAAAFVAAAPSPSPARPRGRIMYLRMLAAVAATAAAVLALLVSMIKPPIKPGDVKPDAGPLALAQVLDATAGAKTLRYSVTANGSTREVMAEKAGRWRDDRGDGTSLVSDGDIVWQLEKGGKATRAREVPLPRDLFRAATGGQKLAAVDLTKIQPKGTEKRDDGEFLVYRLVAGSADGDVTIEALADPATKMLRRLTARRGEKTLGDLRVANLGEDLPEEQFLVLNSLSDDGRVGKLIDTQGVVAVKPLAQGRWTPVADDFVLMPGDWLRTDNRGANAAHVKLLSRSSIIVGPGSLVEVTKATQLKLLEGEIEITAPKGTSVELLAPEDQKVVVKGTQLYFLDRQGKLRLAAKEPLWLKGFKGATADESIGSLVAKVDGRDVPLSVGYHKVVVDIRDQIARTTIEESFVNHTAATLEGVFHFPLPQDASISGFGMWINNELVEADVVEKQRAREIYEEIMREKRDPGLLEWAGGNIFKARVWPIFAHSEKRIKITYTQVLPLKGNRYTYSYALQSEMLQQNPLRDLSLTVNVASEAGLKRVWSPTHTTRDQATANAARVEFTAQDYTPRKDFEVVVEQEKRASDVAIVPHRRGADGYFLLQVMPPAVSQERAILPDSGPVRLLILADTSASMDRKQRAQQEAFIASLVSSLTPADTFNLACCDVTCDWAFAKPVAAEAKNLVAARAMLEQRVSLGWTDLDKAFATVMAEADARTHVVYVGDGIPVTASADPVEFAKRLKGQYMKRGTFHAVTTGASYEPGVVKAIASLGGGSWRRVGAEQGPTAVAVELLREITQPTLRDVKVEFKNLRTARVYPAELPNVPAGMQQILLGRYLPDGNDQQGEVVVTGTLDGKPVTMAAKVSLKDAEAGNSFIPRLWARMHLDALLELGSSESIKDEVIALSEEFNIMTPYTSFLVLESDADRVRFGVKKRFRMRDGEKFFAESRDGVDFALVQQQMKRAGTWRVNLRRDVLRSFANLGRNLQAIRHDQERREKLGAKQLELQDSESGNYFGRLGEMDGRLAGFGGGMPTSETVSAAPWGNSSVDWDGSMPSESKAMAGDQDEMLDQLSKKKDSKNELDEADKAKRGREGDAKDLTPGKDDAFAGDELSAMRQQMKREEFAAAASSPATHQPGEPGWVGDMDEPMFDRRKSIRDGYEFAELEERTRAPANGYFKSRIRNRDNTYNESLHWQQQWWGTIFPALPPSAKVQPAKPSKWPEAARKLAQSLLRRDALNGLRAGVELQVTAEAFDHRSGEVTSRGVTVNLYSPKSWLTRWQHDGQQTIVNWSDAKERGLIHRAFGVGRVRPATADDLAVPFSLNDYSLGTLDESYGGYTPTIENVAKDRVRLVMKHGGTEIRTLIDTARRVLLSIEYIGDGKVTSAVKFDDFVEVADQWWARSIVSTNEKGERTGRTILTIRERTANEFAARIKEELADRARTLMVKAPLPRLVDARKALAEKKAGLEDRVALMRHAVAIQQWTTAREHESAIDKLTDSPAKRWLHDAIHHLSRRFDELKHRQLDEAAKLPGSGLAANDQYALAQHVYGRSTQFMQSAEVLDLLAKLEPAYKTQPAHLHATRDFRRFRMYQLNALGRSLEGMAILKELAAEYPRDASVQQEYAQALANLGDYDAALAWIDKTLAANTQWIDHEEENLRNLKVNYLTVQGRIEDVLKYAETWMARKPATRTPYHITLGTLVRLDQEGKANQLTATWLKDGQIRGKLPPEVAGRLSAAIAQAMGQGHHLHTGRIEEQWVAPLVAVVKFFAHDERNGQYADTVMGQLNHSHGDHVAKLVKELAADLLEAVGTLKPDRIDRLVRFVGSHGETDYWKNLAAALHTRWQATREQPLREALANSLLNVLQSRRGIDDVLAFKRLRLQQADPEVRPALARSLFDSLLAPGWKQEYEDEAFALLPALADGLEPAQRTHAMVEALYRLNDRMVPARIEVLNQKIERPDTLTRTELADKRAANVKEARAAYADRLAKEFARSPKEVAPWVKMERMYFDVVLNRNLAQVEADCWEILGDEPPKPVDPDADVVAAPKPDDGLQAHLQERAFATLNYLATRPKADADSVTRLVKYLDKGIAREGDGTAWKTAKYRLLIAADRPKDLEAMLTPMTAKGPLANYWRINLGFLLAELGRLKESVALFETAREAGELGPMAYRSLADWYMVLNQKDKHEQALLDQYRFTEEYRLSQAIQRKLQPWQRGDQHMPSELDKDVLRMFAVLFEKSAQPANYVHQVHAFYQACRDFRLLAVLADAIVGQTPMKVYPFLQSFDSIFNNLQDEAVVDQMMEQLAKTRKAAKTVIDRRALDLTEALVRRRAGELKNQAGQHGDLALAALKRAFEHPWADAEQPQMANLLRSMGSIAYKPLAEEQMRQMKWLHGQQKKSSYDRLHVGHMYAGLLHNYGRAADGIDVLAPDLSDFIAASNGVMSNQANDAALQLANMYRSIKRHAEAEQFLVERLRKPGNEEQRMFFAEQLNNIYIDAMVQNSKTTLGQGVALYPVLEQRLRKDCAQSNPSHQYRMVVLTCQFFSTARDLKIEAFAADLKQFGNKVLPELMKAHHNYHDAISNHVAGVFHTLLGPRDTIEYVLNRIEKEPEWFRLNNQDGWYRHGGSLAQWRSEVKGGLGDLEPRLLKVVLGALRRDLDTNRSNQRSIYHKHSGYYWAEKEDEFVTVAEDVYSKRQNSLTVTLHIADYFYHSLGRGPRAIEILYAAHGKKILTEDGVLRLVQYLREQSRHQEAIVLLEPLVVKHPANLTYRVWLMNSYHRTGQTSKVLASLKQAHDFFHLENRWNEGVSAALAASCLENELWQQSADYYKEAIPLRQRASRNRGIGDGVLAEYYSNLARAYSRLGKTEDAVDAASGAVVAWPNNHHSRTHYLDRLREVLTEAKDIDQFVAKLDVKEKQSGIGSPVIRKGIAKAYQTRGEFNKAIAQYRAALELQPEDMESHEQLIACLDQQGDKEGAIAATLESIERSRRNLALYKRLGDRMGEMNRHHDAERAFTSIVEMQPNEAESHTLLAQVRQGQTRLDESAAHWEQAAKHRALEPTALIELAKVQLALKQWDKADASIGKLEKTAWPQRFDNVRGSIQQLRATWKDQKR